MSKKQINLNINDICNIVTESAEKIISEMDWKTYANAAKKRQQQFRGEADPTKKNKLFNSYYNLRDKARERFDDDYIGDYKYDTFGDKVRGKNSPKFDVGMNMTDKPYGLLNGYNKSGDKLFSTKKGTYTSQSVGHTSPRKFFRNKEVADNFTTANDELWDYHNGDYEYDSIKNGGSGEWNKKIKEAINRTINEISESYEYGTPDSATCNQLDKLLSLTPSELSTNELIQINDYYDAYSECLQQADKEQWDEVVDELQNRGYFD